MHKLAIPLFILSSFLLQSVCWARAEDPTSKKVDSLVKEVAEAKGTAEQAKNTAKEAKNIAEETKKALEIGQRAGKDFAGLHFGVGIGFTRTFGRDRIETATNENGIVRIDGEKNAIPRVLLESHFFLTPKQWGELFDCGDYSNDEKGHFGIGPFVGIQPGTDQIIQAIAAGIMVGFKDPILKNANNSWNIGLGISLEPSSKTLGDGLKPNEPVPAGATVHTQTRSLAGITALLSYGW